jgi:hypothetical protein
VYVRLVPRDLWLRMHIDLRSTMGAVKDAVLDRAGVPHADPTLSPHFFEEVTGAAAAGTATKNGVVIPADPGVLPKVFIARKAGYSGSSDAPDIASLADLAVSAESASARQRAKAASAASAARAILGGDPGRGGPGRLGPVGVSMSSSLSTSSADSSNLLPQSKAVGKRAASPRSFERPAMVSRASSPMVDTLGVSSVTTAHRTPRPMASFSALGAATAKDGPSSSHSQTNLASLPGSPASVQTSRNAAAGSSSPTPQRATDPRASSLVTLGGSPALPAARSAYLDYTQHGLPGNVEALRLEQEALARSRAPLHVAPAMTASTSVASTSTSTDASLRSPSSEEGMRLVRLSAAAKLRQAGVRSPFDSEEEDPLEGSTSEEEDLWSVAEGGTGAADEDDSRSSISMSSCNDGDGLRTRDESVLWGTQLEEAMERRAAEQAADAAGASREQLAHLQVDAVRRSSTATGQSSTSSNSGRHKASSERMRSGTITAASALAARGGPIALPEEQDAPTPHSAKVPVPVRSSSAGLSEPSSLPCGDGGEPASLDSVISLNAAASVEPSSMPEPAKALLRGGRIAGIQLDEISAWDKATHPLSSRFSVYSFANGHLMEDWRTVAAFRLRPFELLEVQLARPRDRIHLPRTGEANMAIMSEEAVSRRKRAETASNAVVAAAAASGATGAALLRAAPTSAPAPNANPALDERYVEPFSEGWYYVLKPGSGSSKAQKAGLGMWKLRWVVIRGWSLSIFRQAPTRSYLGTSNGVSSWHLSAIKWAATERADGATNPPSAGRQLASESITIAFSTAVVSDYSIDEAEFAGRSSVTLRALSEYDHRALFNIVARACCRHSGSAPDAETGLDIEAWRRRAIARATIAGRGGTVQPGKAGRRAGRNALARARLRPQGVSRAFDDADRWSSGSEEEASAHPVPPAVLPNVSASSLSSPPSKAELNGPLAAGGAPPRTPPPSTSKMPYAPPPPPPVDSSPMQSSPSRSLIRMRGFSLSRNGRQQASVDHADSSSNYSPSGTPAGSPARPMRNSGGPLPRPRGESLSAGRSGSLTSPWTGVQARDFAHAGASATNSPPALPVMPPHAGAERRQQQKPEAPPSGPGTRARSHTVGLSPSASRPRHQARDDAPVRSDSPSPSESGSYAALRQFLESAPPADIVARASSSTPPRSSSRAGGTSGGGGLFRFRRNQG